MAKSPLPVPMPRSEECVVEISTDSGNDTINESDGEDRSFMIASKQGDISDAESAHGEHCSDSTSGFERTEEEMMKLIRDGDLKSIKVSHCQAILRRQGLRVGGTKPVLLARIRQHIDLKEGRGIQDFDKSTFTINCTGDVCTGDVVMFRQKFVQKRKANSRNAASLGSRTVAGRVVKESYGEKCQQHTFTVEVLWSTGIEALPPMKQLQVKGRNLYRLKTFRQPWVHEWERKMALDEKHRRGNVARQTRALKQRTKQHGGKCSHTKRIPLDDHRRVNCARQIHPVKQGRFRGEGSFPCTT